MLIDKTEKGGKRKLDLLEGVRRACNAHVPLIDIAIVSQACGEEFGRLLLQFWLATHWLAYLMRGVLVSRSSTLQSSSPRCLLAGTAETQS